MKVNELGEMDDDEPVSERSTFDDDIDYSMGSFIQVTGDGGFVSVNPEFSPSKNAITPTGRYHVYLVDITHGTATFYIALDDNAIWKAEGLPPFVTGEFVDWVGSLIENKEG